MIRNVHVVNVQKTIGNYESSFAINMGQTHIHFCNVASEDDIDMLQFKMYQTHGTYFMIPDLANPDRTTYALHINPPEGYNRLCSVNSSILTYRFEFGDDNSLQVIGRSFPELFMEDGIDVIYQSDDEKYAVCTFRPNMSDDINVLEFSKYGDIPLQYIPKHGNKRQFDKRLTLGLGSYLRSTPPLPNDITVFVNPSVYKSSKTNSDPLIVWCNKWYAGKLPNTAPVTLCPVGDINEKFSENAISEWNTHDIYRRYAFIGYPHSMLVEIRKRLLGEMESRNIERAKNK